MPKHSAAREIAARGTVLLDLREIDRARFPTLMGSLAKEGYDPVYGARPLKRTIERRVANETFVPTNRTIARLESTRPAQAAPAAPAANKSEGGL